MHPDQIAIDEATVRRLLTLQAPRFASLPLRRLASGGTQNAIFRLGEDMSVRLPLIADAGASLHREATALSLLAPHLPLAIPEVLHVGQPDETFPHPWLVQRWLPGADAAATPPDDLAAAAESLAALIAALRRIDAATAPPPAGRGGPLEPRDTPFRQALARCHGLIDTEAAAAAWDAALAAPPHNGPAVWLHADLIPANLILSDGQLAGVIDWGSVTSGDPAYDLIPAWFLLDAATRPLFRRLTGADDATWTRARGCVVWQSVLVLPYYLHSNPTMVALARRGLREALAD